MKSPTEITIHMDDPILNKTALQKFMYGALLYALEEGQPMEFIVTARHKGIRKIKINYEVEDTDEIIPDI